MKRIISILLLMFFLPAVMGFDWISPQVPPGVPQAVVCLKSGCNMSGDIFMNGNTIHNATLVGPMIIGPQNATGPLNMNNYDIYNVATISGDNGNFTTLNVGTLFVDNITGVNILYPNDALLYNDSNYFYFNLTALLDITDDRYNDTNTQVQGSGTYLYDDGTFMYLNQTLLNSTIDDRDSNSQLNPQAPYLYQTLGNLFLNYTALNNSFQSDINETDIWVRLDGGANLDQEVKGDLNVTGTMRAHNYTGLSPVTFIDEGTGEVLGFMSTTNYTGFGDDLGDAYFRTVTIDRLIITDLLNYSVTEPPDFWDSDEIWIIEDNFTFYFNATLFNATVPGIVGNSLSHLSNFTDDLGDRGYTSLSNFTNDVGFLTTETDPIFVGWDYDYLELNNTPQNLSQFANDVGYLTTETDPVFIAWGYDYNNLTNTPTDLANFTNTPGYITSRVTGNEYLYNDSTFMYLNITRLDDRYNDSKWNVVGDFLYTISDSLYFNSTKLNQTIQALDTDTTYSHLSNFTDDLGDRGYTSLSNFTNDLGFITIDAVNDTRVTGFEYLYNDSTYVYLNTTLLDDRYNDTRWSVADYYLYTIGNNIYFNDTRLNTTIAALDTDTTYSHLSNFTDDLGDRGYTSLSNFTNDLGFITIDAVNDTRVTGIGFLYNDSTYMYLNISILDDKYNDTTYQNLSEFFDDLGDRGYTSLSNFTNNVGFLTNETDPLFTAWNYDYTSLIGSPTHLSNFTDDLGDRGYTSLSNFTNDVGYINGSGLNTTISLVINETEYWVDEAGDSMTGPLNMQGNRIYFDDEYWIQLVNNPITGLNETVELRHNATHSLGSILFKVNYFDQTKFWVITKKNDSASGIANSWMVFSDSGLNTSQLQNPDFYTNAEERWRYFGIEPELDYFSAGTGADLAVQHGIETQQLFIHDELGNGFVLTEGEFTHLGRPGTDFDIYNVPLHLRIPRKENITSGLGPVTVFTYDFSGIATGTQPPPNFIETGDGVGSTGEEWSVRNDDRCNSNPCIRARGGDGNAIRGIDTTFSTINISSLYLSFWYGSDNMDAALNDNFSIFINNNVGSGWVMLYNDTTTSSDINPPILLNFSLPSFMENQTSVSLRFEHQANLGGEETFLDEIQVGGLAGTPVQVEVDRNDASIKFGGNTFTQAPCEIFYNDTTNTIEVGKNPDCNVQIYNATFTTINTGSENISGDLAADSFTLNGTTITDWSQTGLQQGQGPYLYDDGVTVYFNETVLNNTIDDRTGIFEENVTITVSGGVGTASTVECCFSPNGILILEVAVFPTTSNNKFRFSANGSVSGDVVDTDRFRHTGDWIVQHRGNVIFNENINYYLTQVQIDESFTVRLRYQK